MSELKVRFIDDTYVEYYNTGKHDLAQVYLKSEADKVIAELKAREDVLVTDNRDLLEKVKMLENQLRENAEHFKRNEAQILENSDKAIAEKDKEIARLDDLAHAHNIELLRKENLIADKDKEIQRLENLCESYRIDCDNLAIREANAYKEIGRDNKKIIHQKHKRCLAMARWCFTKSNYHFVLARHGEDDKENNRKSILYSKWCKRWLAIADKYKHTEITKDILLNSQGALPNAITT